MNTSELLFTIACMQLFLHEPVGVPVQLSALKLAAADTFEQKPLSAKKAPACSWAPCFSREVCAVLLWVLILGWASFNTAREHGASFLQAPAPGGRIFCEETTSSRPGWAGATRAPWGALAAPLGCLSNTSAMLTAGKERLLKAVFHI